MLFLGQTILIHPGDYQIYDYSVEDISYLDLQGFRFQRITFDGKFFLYQGVVE